MMSIFMFYSTKKDLKINNSFGLLSLKLCKNKGLKLKESLLDFWFFLHKKLEKETFVNKFNFKSVILKQEAII
jgi:hypothetical protein